MPYPIEQKLVIAVASSALFDLGDADKVFREQGVEAYRKYQREHEEKILGPGVAFPLIRRLLRLNRLLKEHHVEVILLSRNDPDTGLRVFNSIESHNLDISRAAFTSGRPPFRYASPFNACLFLSADEADVRHAVRRGLPAGHVHPTEFADQEADLELRIAFDFDGVVADDESETVYKEDGLEAFQASEVEFADRPMNPGPLKKFFAEIARLQEIERKLAAADADYEQCVRTAIVTARNAPAHTRVVTTLRDWGIEVDEAFFLGGIDKTGILEEFRPHIFFDDQLVHVAAARGTVPCAHIPFGAANQEVAEEEVEKAFDEARRELKERSAQVR